MCIINSLTLTDLIHYHLVYSINPNQNTSIWSTHHICLWFTLIYSENTQILPTSRPHGYIAYSLFFSHLSITQCRIHVFNAFKYSFSLYAIHCTCHIQELEKFTMCTLNSSIIHIFYSLPYSHAGISTMYPLNKYNVPFKCTL